MSASGSGGAEAAGFASASATKTAITANIASADKGKPNLSTASPTTAAAVSSSRGKESATRGAANASAHAPKTSSPVRWIGSLFNNPPSPMSAKSEQSEGLEISAGRRFALRAYNYIPSFSQI